MAGREGFHPATCKQRCTRRYWAEGTNHRLTSRASFSDDLRPLEVSQSAEDAYGDPESIPSPQLLRRGEVSKAHQSISQRKQLKELHLDITRPAGLIDSASPTKSDDVALSESHMDFVGTNVLS